MGSYEIEKDQYDKINALATRMESLVGAVEVSNKITAKLISLHTKIFYCLFTLLLVCIGAIIYGAIGERGMKTVRETMPSIPRLSFAIPADDGGLDKWLHHKS